MASHVHDLNPWVHSHQFDAGNREGETRTRWVLAITLVTMAVEIVAGWWTGSMALLADGWHMGTHALALGVATLAYALARRHANDTRYAFGTWKIEVLGGFASALVLALVAVGVAGESAVRLWNAEPIAARSALIVAVIGLVVNLLSAWLLHGAQGGDHAHHGHGDGHGHRHDAGQKHVRAQHAHDHDHDHDHDHEAHDDHDHHAHGHDTRESGPGHDLNLRAAYVHVLADAFTSLLAIGALAAALWMGWWWADPLVGVLGAIVIGSWAWGLLRQSSTVLLDREMDHPLTQDIRRALESDGDAKVCDLHVWRVGRNRFAAVAGVVADAPLTPSDYRARLGEHPQLAHFSVEVNRCAGAAHGPH